MKKIITALIGTLVFMGGLTAGKIYTGKVPANVISSFAAKYPNIKMKDWESKNGNYIAKFVQNKDKCFAYYTPDGKWVKTEIKLNWTKDLPVPVREGLKNDGYADWRVIKINEVQKKDLDLYVVRIDDWNLLDADHSYAFTRDYQLSFTKDGILESKKDISN